jgi:hypothetical protein
MVEDSYFFTADYMRGILEVPVHATDIMNPTEICHTILASIPNST